MSVLISVIVPIYNVEKYLTRCVDSLLAQSYPNLEIVLVDDGSPDKCPEICDIYKQDHQNITVIHKTNGGLSSARNAGVLKAKGEWIVFVDSDDYVEKDYIYDLWKLKTKFKTSIAITRVLREKENGGGKPRGKLNFDDFVKDKENAIKEVYIRNHVGWQAYGKLFNKNVLLSNPFPEGLYEDCACMYRIIDCSDSVAFGNYEKNYHYIWREESILRSKLSKKHMHIFKICDEFEMFIMKKYPELSLVAVEFRRSAVTQMLNLNKMPYKQYRDIYLKYRSYFRKNLFRILKSGDYGRAQKIYLFLHCLTPEIYRFINCILSAKRKVLTR